MLHRPWFDLFVTFCYPTYTLIDIFLGFWLLAWWVDGPIDLAFCACDLACQPWPGFEPGTLRLRGGYSDHLSYQATRIQKVFFYVWVVIYCDLKQKKIKRAAETVLPIYASTEQLLVPLFSSSCIQMTQMRLWVCTLPGNLGILTMFFWKCFFWKWRKCVKIDS